MPWDSPPKVWGAWGQTHAFALPQFLPRPGPCITGRLILRRAAAMDSGCPPPPQKGGGKEGGGSCSSIPHPAQTRGRKGRCLLTPGTWPAPSPPLHGTPGRSGSHHSLRSAPIPPPRSPQPNPSCPPGMGRAEWGGCMGCGGRSTLAPTALSPTPPCPRCHRTSPQSPVNTAPTALGRGSWRGLSPPRGHYWWGGGGNGVGATDLL